MPDKEKKDEFVVTDRRRRYEEEENESTPEPQAQTPPPTPAPPQPEPQAAAPTEPAPEDAHAPAPPTAEERERSNAEYRKSADNMESELRKQYGSQMAGVDFQVRFEDILEPFYVTALMQLGGMGQEGQQRRVDPIGARRTIDTLELLREKMKGNLSQQEFDLMEVMLYQLRMAYMDVINALTRPAPGGGPAPMK